MPASCLPGSGSLYPCTCQSCTLCQGCWAEQPAAWHARTQGGGGHGHQLPLGSPNRGWCEHVTVTVRLTITSRTGSALPVCFSSRPGFWSTPTERAIQQLDSYVDGPMGRQNHLLSCSTDMLPVSHLFHLHCPQKSPQFSEELWQMKQTGKEKGGKQAFSLTHSSTDKITRNEDWTSFDFLKHPPAQPWTVPCLLSVLEPQIPIARRFHLIFCGSSLSSGLVLLNTWEWGSGSSLLTPITESIYQAPGLMVEWQKTRVQWLNYSLMLPVHEEGCDSKICAVSRNNLWHIAQIMLTPGQLMQHWAKTTGCQTSVSHVYGHLIDFKYFSLLNIRRCLTFWFSLDFSHQTELGEVF